MPRCSLRIQAMLSCRILREMRSPASRMSNIRPTTLPHTLSSLLNFMAQSVLLSFNPLLPSHQQPPSPLQDYEMSTESLRTMYSSDTLLHSEPDVESTRHLDMSQFTILKLLNRGQRGKIYLVQDKMTNSPRVLRIVPKIWTSATASAMREQEILRYLLDLHTPHVARLRGSWYDESYFYILTDYFHGSDMAFELLRSKKFSEERAKFYIAQLLVALESLHHAHIIYRSVAPHNILIDRDGYIVLSSFGSAKLFKSEEGGANGPFISNDIIGIPHYMSPEAHNGASYSFETDFWGLGVVLYQMVTGRLPFGHDLKGRDAALPGRIRDEPLRFEDSDGVSAITQQFISKLLEKDPAKRLLPYEIKQHPFFNTIEWNKLSQRAVAAPWKPRVVSTCSSTSSIVSIPEDKFKIRDSRPVPSFIYYPPLNEPEDDNIVSPPSHPRSSRDTPSPSAASSSTKSSRPKDSSENKKRRNAGTPTTALPLCLIWKLISLIFPMLANPSSSRGGSSTRRSRGASSRTSSSPILPTHSEHIVDTNSPTESRDCTRLSTRKFDVNGSGILVTVDTIRDDDSDISSYTVVDLSQEAVQHHQQPKQPGLLGRVKEWMGSMIWDKPLPEQRQTNLAMV